MALACKICILEKGLKGSEIGDLPKNEEGLLAHIEEVHHLPVMMKGETQEAAIERFLKKYPQARTCEDCKKKGAPWAS